MVLALLVWGMSTILECWLSLCWKEGYKDSEGSGGEDGAAEVPWFAQPGAEEAEGKPLACNSLQGREWRGSTELFFPVTATGAKGTSWSCVRGGLGVC